VKTRELTGMNVTELSAPHQDKLFEDLAKFCRGRSVDVITFDTVEDGDPKKLERAVVVWA